LTYDFSLPVRHNDDHHHDHDDDDDDDEVHFKFNLN